MRCHKEENLMTIDKLVNVMNRIASTALLATATIGFASAQTPFVISSVNSGLVLDVKGASKDAGTLVQQWTPNGGTNQQWTLRRFGTGLLYEIVSVNSGLVLDVEGRSTSAGAGIDQYFAQGTPNQLWNIYRRPGTTQGYAIVSEQVSPAPYSPGRLSSPANLVLDVPGLSTAPGTAIQQYTENDGLNQQWLFNSENQNTISLSPPSSYDAPIKISGWHFTPGIEVCPVLEDPLGGNAPCTTVQSDGTFSYGLGLQQPYTVMESGSGYMVVLIDDDNGNVLAIGSVAGSLLPSPPK
jgi:hypothetical protein